MRAYYFDNIPGDQRLPHDSNTPVDDAVLTSIGVLHWHIPVPVPTTDGQCNDYPDIDAVARERGYKNRDVITCTKQGLGDLYEAKIKSFFEECVFSWSRSSRLESLIRDDVLQAYARR